MELDWLTVLPASVLVLEPVVEVTVEPGVVVSPGVVEPLTGLLQWLVPASVLVLEPVVEVKRSNQAVRGKSGSSGTCLAYGARARLRARTGASS